MMTATELSTELIHPNEYNPNRMTDDEFAELVAEVEHLGRLPKPVVVRRNGDGYLIVDGEHGWRVAKEIGLNEIPCEVIEADDFESMRQTYKRNQHGTHDPVLLGQMFQQMMKSRKLSQRKLAKEISVSEGTIRNSLEYAKATKVRNDYAFSELSVEQVRWFNRLSKAVGNLWLGMGADIDQLYKAAGYEGFRHGKGSRAIVIETTWSELEAGQWRSQITPKQAIGSCLGWVAAGIPIVMAGTHQRAGEYIARLIFTSARRRWREARQLVASVQQRSGTA